MKATIGEDGGVIVAFEREFIKLTEMHGGLLTPEEARLLASLLIVMAGHLEANEVL